MYNFSESSKSRSLATPDIYVNNHTGAMLVTPLIWRVSFRRVFQSFRAWSPNLRFRTNSFTCNIIETSRQRCKGGSATPGRRAAIETPLGRTRWASRGGRGRSATRRPETGWDAVVRHKALDTLRRRRWVGKATAANVSGGWTRFAIVSLISRRLKIEENRKGIEVPKQDLYQKESSHRTESRTVNCHVF